MSSPKDESVRLTDTSSNASMRAVFFYAPGDLRLLETPIPSAGPGEIVATDNGDATSFESFQSPEHNAYNGLALVIVRSKAGERGAIKLTAKSDGLVAATIKIKAN